VLKKSRVFFVAGILLFSLIAIPLSKITPVRGAMSSFFKAPLQWSSGIAQWFLDLFYFSKNARENQALKKTLGQMRLERFEAQELKLENARLARLLNLKQVLPSSLRRVLFSRVIARLPSDWNRAFLIDKGSHQGVKPNLLALSSDLALVGKVVEVGPSTAKVILITDPDLRVGALIQRTRQTGILFGASQGQCRMKYLSMDEEIKPGDVVQSAGFGGFFPKGLIVGKVERVWKEPGQIYQVADIKPLADLSRLEEVALVE
jgi:rod shape-determining protein MreC